MALSVVRIQDGLLRVVSAHPGARARHAAKDVDAWIAAVVARHRDALTKTEFLKSIRALSARYVERRSDLSRRSAIDSAGKRAAFGAFFAPLHFLTIREIVRALDLVSTPPRTLLDLGCGTGVASAAWAAETDRAPEILGVDRDSWALDEARWNWRTLGLRGRTRRGDLGTAAEPPPTLPTRAEALLFAWSVNELAGDERRRLLAAITRRASRGQAILVVEPLAQAASPWWNEWVGSLSPHGARSDVWKFDAPLPPVLAEVDEAAGFRREGLGARTLYLPPA